jgi:hypothetical protein
LDFNANAGTLNSPSATCSACSCGAPNGVGCPTAATDFWTNNSCNGTLDLTQLPSAANTCFPVTNAVMGYFSAAAAIITPSGGSCSDSGGSATVPAATWSADAVVCEGATLGAGCPGTEACAPPPSSAFESGVCIYRGGNHSCSAPFTVKHTIYTTINDFRGCTNCNCDPPTNVACSGVTELYEGVANSTCTGTPVTVPHTGTCTPVTLAGSMVFVPGSASGGTCDPSGGNPTGTALPGAQETVCCTP